jgi:glycosyltransferase involved in cell wall biosynthesis
VISFVVPAYNEAQLIAATLDAIHAAARGIGHPYEIIVADDASTDGTAAIAEAHGARVVPCAHRQIARVRNTGARASAGNVLIFVDADTLVSREVVRASLDAIARGAAGGGADLRIEGDVPLWARPLVFVISESMRLFRWAAGCYVFCTRAAFDAAGGFDERLFATEEIALSRALKRIGPVVILREKVTTSGRKLRTHSAGDFLRLLAGVAAHGPAFLRTRERLSVWYGERRDEHQPRP